MQLFEFSILAAQMRGRSIRLVYIIQPHRPLAYRIVRHAAYFFLYFFFLTSSVHRPLTRGENAFLSISIGLFFRPFRPAFPLWNRRLKTQHSKRLTCKCARRSERAP